MAAVSDLVDIQHDVRTHLKDVLHLMEVDTKFWMVHMYRNFSDAFLFEFFDEDLSIFL